MKTKLIVAALIGLLIVLMLPAIIAFVDIMTWFYTGHNLSGFVWSYERAFIVMFSLAFTIPVASFAYILIDY